MGQSPSNHASLGIGTNRKILSNRTKFVNKFSNNIHIIPENQTKKSMYDGLFNLKSKELYNKEMIQIEQNEYKEKNPRIVKDA